MEITTIGLDLAKSIFQVHAVDAAGTVVVCKALRRSQVVPFFTKLPRAWSASKRAAPLIIGHAPWQNSGTRFG